ncbi:growth hormone receptor a isoform X2 [Conger conger]|uniref:growth hormone receptor a isoform X2 n=1 Tax=Conger conger TaxID=82655 RepID=UPI002A5AE375|nr:growth hormone receptor a isoform X2 [Conger conger]
MAASLFVILIFLPCLLLGAGAEGAATPSEALVQDPHITGCLSREQETFRCWWSAGSFQNLTEPGALRVFFATSRPSGWMECPDYSVDVPNECYFNKSYTSIWTKYCVQLRAQAQNITYSELCFDVQNIVHPDPPIRLNWTLLSVSRSGLHFDIIVHWAPPPSADVKGGWMTLVYEVHYRERNASKWTTLEQEGIQQSIYGLQTGTEYEIRVRCKMRSFENFGDLSEAILVYIQPIPTKESQFPLTRILIFGAVGIGILLVLFAFSRQQKLMVILLPPVPAPKIKGIDPDLLKKGKLEELSSILSSHHTYQPEPYQEDDWVEFIEVDAGDSCEKSGPESDTQRLLGSSSGLLGLKDDDSGRASCYDPEFPDLETPELASPDPLAPPKQGPGSAHLATPCSATPSPTSAEPAHPLIQTRQGTQPWVNMDFYAQVSDVTPSGGVVLSPGQQGGAPEKAEEEKKKEEEKKGEEEKEGQEKEKEEEREKSKKKKKEEEKKFQLVVVDPEGGAYTSERDAHQISAEFKPGQGYTPDPPQAPAVGVPAGGYQSPYLLIETPPCPPLPPVSDYTVVQDVDAQHSLLLNPTPPEPQIPHPPTPAKPLPPMPVGYLTPDLLGNITP